MIINNKTMCILSLEVINIKYIRSPTGYQSSSPSDNSNTQLEFTKWLTNEAKRTVLKASLDR